MLANAESVTAWAVKLFCLVISYMVARKVSTGGRRVIAVLTFAVCMMLQSHAISTAIACGLDWSFPTNYFDGVDDRGHVAYWETIGEVDCGEGLRLPLYVNYNSGRDVGVASPYLGQGWMLPLQESNFVQEGEDRFVMTQPDGLKNLFLRAEPNGTILNGSAGWKGEIKGDTITAWASCGWKIVFSNGHITSMWTPESRRLDWVYQGGRISELREGNIVRLKVAYNSDGRVTGLDMPAGKNIIISQSKKPRIQTVGAQNMLIGIDSSLSEVLLPDGEKHDFIFGTDEKLFPTLKVVWQNGKQSTMLNDERNKITWDPTSKHIIRDKTWQYNVAAATQIGDTATISRHNLQNQTEQWDVNDRNGQKTVQTVGGPVITYTRFVSGGPLIGKMRKITEKGLTDNSPVTVFQPSYDDKGRLLRAYDHGVTRIFNYDAEGALISFQTVSGKQ